jgi:hypothetical protein
MCQTLWKRHHDVLKGWKICTAVATPDIDHLEEWSEKNKNKKYMPCSACLNFTLFKTSDLGCWFKNILGDVTYLPGAEEEIAARTMGFMYSYIRHKEPKFRMAEKLQGESYITTYTGK